MAAAVESASPSSSIYAQVDSYPWDTDAEFQGGLSAILGSNPPSDRAAELTLRARCFYYSRKFNASVDFDAYKAYRASIGAPPPSLAANGPATAPATTSTLPDPAPASSSAPTAPATVSAVTAPSAAASATASAAVPPDAPYPTSFAHIVELITTGQPIPGIKEIPDTVLAGQGTAPTASKRRKPWERDHRRNTL
ncbi:uncharacterized protein K452DRAFT_324013 [Aplosporella prunicola CBS 121167]|uniref:Uncharacterized protein n=1 Tax=Aplosporella prunicola CBS 121167 TaxID=1176127 RepID=A0A6A6BST1_9PEZI|nr:uncharacterized protein K452DRAFT_324013 [Aplosporella prunicola CBS 121167]KAF2145887.1 hypothetical protein K452DRAFT_324013 [Aplosporella prunicola CBS 121167]